MTDAEQNFIASVKNLESFNSGYIQANKALLINRSPTQIQPTSLISSSAIPTGTLTPTAVVIDDYVRMCRMYCVMLWTYCDAFGLKSTVLNEIKLIRHCLIHHEGDMARYSLDPTFGAGGVTLINLTNGKPYVQGYSLLISDIDLITFTDLVKVEFTSSTGVPF